MFEKIIAFIFVSLVGIIAWFIKKNLAQIESDISSIKKSLNQDLDTVSKDIVRVHDEFLNEKILLNTRHHETLAKIEKIGLLFSESEKRNEEKYQLINKEMTLLRVISERLVELQGRVIYLEKQNEDLGKVIRKP